MTVIIHRRQATKHRVAKGVSPQGLAPFVLRAWSRVGKTGRGALRHFVTWLTASRGAAWLSG